MGEATPTKIGFNAFHVNLYLHKFFELILFFDPWSEGKFWLFKLVSMYFTSTSTCMNFLSQFHFLIQKGNLAIFEGAKSPKPEKGYTHQTLCKCRTYGHHY